MSPSTTARLCVCLTLAACLALSAIGCGKRSDVKLDGGKPDDKGARGADKGKVVDDEGMTEGGKLALVVGVAGYDNKAFNDLKYTENDAEKLAAALTRPEAGFRVRVLTGTRGKKEKADAPTAANIKRAIDGLLKGRKKGDTVMVAFAGHGVTLELKDPDGKEGPRTYPYFCAADADLLDPRFSDGQSETMINLDDLFARLGRCGAGTKLVLMDACRNQLTVKAGRRSLDAGSVTIPVGVAALYSCGRGQFAYETEKLGKGHGVFFHFAIEGLLGKAKDDEGNVTWASLSNYVTRQTTRQVPKLIGDGSKQTPAALGSLEGESPVLVAAAKKEPGEKDGKKEKDGSAVVKDGEKKDGEKPEVKPGAKEIKNSIDMKLVLIPAGKFTMGSPRDEKDRVADEHPHEVTFTKAIYMGVYEVTQVQYLKVMKENPSTYRLGGAYERYVKGMDTDDFPVDNVSWDQAVEFCKKLSALPREKEAGRTYRLPTEAEWEYACRAGTRTTYQFGDTMSAKKANAGFSNQAGGYLGRPCEVGRYKPNAWGLYDMHGNVFEWCSDWYAERYYKDGPGQDKDPQGPEEGTQRVLRGGAFDSYDAFLRAAARWKSTPGTKSYANGFRVVCEVSAGK